MNRSFEVLNIWQDWKHQSFVQKFIDHQWKGIDRSQYNVHIVEMAEMMID
jgi:hypothetical protein